MKKFGLIILILLLNLNLGYSQTESEIDSLLIGIAETENSKEIIKTVQAEKIRAFGENSLIILAEFFTDTTLTKVKSECHNRNLTKGEIAIIMADRIESMPYFTVTRIQNCTLTFCKNNPNRIEYYFSINNYLNNKVFKERYVEWLFSEDRLKSVKGKDRKKRKKILTEWKNNSR
ncbi:hypothetical protein [Psychroserpens algicola]|uniref:DUF4476 domain-containing protein n=1 Tax=Psychroserpens algicola TaxID=1719034 RepID=A0ABT0HD46_9FLAO|nr:hypothetical protein [Psychroserpens algicola]MCK8482298.1 hypothetical protein [Psychroserpens algicola]